MPKNAKWVFCDSKQLWNSKLELYRSEDNRFLSFILIDAFNPIDVISSGTYLKIRIKKDKSYFAVSESNDPSIELFKIYEEV